ncbi:SDR family oxidoreductase [Aquabacterium sp.]|uniref:SDR family oxidoreductase n=1 Tax=Aquabacterium sp. TaxID=1872578 RepID=UPI0037830015
MDIRNQTLLITGANRGLGLAFAREALARGARRVYAAARDPASVKLPGVVPLRLDVTQPDEAAAAAREAPDVTLLVNNAGIAMPGSLLRAEAVAEARAMLDTNFLGPLQVSQAFAPVLAANGGGAILNVLSVASWISGPLLPLYAASKSAAWSLTNGLRIALAAQRTRVVALHAGFIDTDLTRGLDAPKSTPEAIVRAAYDGLAAGQLEILADDITRQVRAGLGATPPVYLPPSSA